MRGGFSVHVTQVRENRMLQHTHHVTVPWSNMKLDVKWERFVSKLRPGQEETWTATITGPDAEKAVAEMVATLYDASLDAFAPHHWQRQFGIYRHDYSSAQFHFRQQRPQASAACSAVGGAKPSPSHRISTGHSPPRSLGGTPIKYVPEVVDWE